MPDLTRLPSKFIIIFGLVAIVFAFLYSRLEKWPDVPLDETYGRYSNACCSDIIIRGKYIQYGPDSETYTAQRMKYGTEITVAKPLGQFYRKDVSGIVEANTFVITRRNRVVVLQARSYSGVDYSFRKMD